MRDVFQLRIVTPRQQLIDQPVREVTGPGTLGEFGVLAEHMTFLTALEIGTLSFRTEQGPRRVALRGGFAEVIDDVMTVLAEDAVFAEEIDPSAARSDLQAAESKLQGLSPIDDAYPALDAARRWAQIRIDTAAAR